MILLHVVSCIKIRVYYKQVNRFKIQLENNFEAI